MSNRVRDLTNCCRSVRPAIGQSPKCRDGSDAASPAYAWSRDVAHAMFVRMTKPAVRVIAAVVARGDRLLVCQRPDHKRHGTLFEFPGGKVEAGESDADAAARELAEELGVTVTAVASELFAVTDPGSAFHIAFLPVDIIGEPQCLEHIAHVWGTQHELTALPLAPSDRQFVEFLIANPGALRPVTLK